MNGTIDPQLIEAINDIGEKLVEISSKSYTITGAADWPILVSTLGVIAALLSLMWLDLRGTLKTFRTMLESYREEWKRELKDAEDQLWLEIRRCQERCQEKCKWRD